MLHVHCGDTSASSLAGAITGGKVIVWTDVLHDGPVLINGGMDAYRQARASFLSRPGDKLDEETVLGWLARQDEELARATEHDEVVFWFDACLFDQLILARHLDWLDRQDLDGTRASLVCIGEFPGKPRFKGLGELTGAELLGLLPSRLPVTQLQSTMGRELWTAFTSPEPCGLTKWLSRNTAPLPYMRDAIIRLLEQYPDTLSGTSRLEREILAALSERDLDPVELFKAVDVQEARPYFGDTTLFSTANRLASGRHPLIEIRGPGPLPEWNPQGLHRWSIRITLRGATVLDGCSDNIKLNGIDRWIGGVHLLSPRNVWRWDTGIHDVVLSR